MKPAPSMPLFGDAYMADTRHLSLEEHGAYLSLLMIAWRTEGCRLPDDDARIARMLGVTGKKWAKLKPTVMAFWTLTKEGWEQKRLTKERRFVAKKVEQNTEAANARWGAKSLESKSSVDANAHANAMPKRCRNDAPPPPPKKKSSVDKSTAAEPLRDPVKELFEMGVSILVEAGVSEQRARSLIGKWKKDRGEGEVMSAFAECRRGDISEPVEWLTKRLKAARYVSKSGYEYRGDEDGILREAERRADWDTYWKVKGKDRKVASR